MADDVAQDRTATDESSALSYDEPEEAAECIREAFEQQLGSSLEGEIEVSTIDIATAKRLLQEHDQSLSGDAPIAIYTRKLLRNEDALIYFFEFSAGEHAPAGALFLPFPNEDLGVPSGRPDSPGLTIRFGGTNAEESEQVRRPDIAKELLEMRERDQALRQELAAQTN